ncbi:hypothetical protein B0H14DRAFT_2618226 [Mycena olivaceomarginata]|nr:hypothetical protein B0H14DRAFT_2618226 [Mycena olivaceomarginata]
MPATDGTWLNIVPFIIACTSALLGLNMLMLVEVFAFLAPIASQDVVKTIVRRIGHKILEHGQSAFDKNNSISSKCPTKDGLALGKDIISVLLRAWRNRPRKEFLSYGRDLSDDDIQKSNFWTQWLKKGDFTLDSSLQTKHLSLQSKLLRGVVVSHETRPANVRAKYRRVAVHVLRTQDFGYIRRQ